MAAIQRKSKTRRNDDNFKSVKKTKRTEEVATPGADELVGCLQRICTSFGIGGVYNSKKSKIESKGGTLEVLCEGWIEPVVIKDLPSLQQKRYIEVLSERTLQLVLLLKEIIRFYDKLQGNEKRQFKSVSMDMLVKDLKLSPTSPPPQRYTQMGLWSEVMRVNQGAYRSFDKFINDGRDTSEMQTDQKTLENTSEESSTVQQDPSEKAKSFRDFYMEIVTSSFADDLDRLRKQSDMDGKQVALLIDCLEAGKDIWSGVEKDLLQSSFGT